MRILHDIRRLFFPEICSGCGEAIVGENAFLCTACRWELPETGFAARKDNPVWERLSALLPIETAFSAVYYTDSRIVKHIVAGFKYHGVWKNAEQCGRMMGKQMAEGGLYDDIDVVMPVPLHFFRRLRRGYNQAEYLARGIARIIDKPVCTSVVKRRRHNRTQTKRTARQRWENTAGIFAVRNYENYAGSHILLVDDVLTTGATLISCAEQIKRMIPDVKISIATFATTTDPLE